jgi:putative IMPACT (imprinted ancient) family translation regulator
MDHYFTIGKPAVAEFKDRGSKFLAYAFHIKTTNAFKQHLKDLKKEHAKAVHHCFAYRLVSMEIIFGLVMMANPRAQQESTYLHK